MAQKIKFRLFSGYTNFNTGCTIDENWHYADTIMEIWHAASPVGVVRSNIALELLQPLLRDDLTRAERILAQFRFAATLIHETAVSLLPRKGEKMQCIDVANSMLCGLCLGPVSLHRSLPPNHILRMKFCVN
jgi:hypothetical protein